MKHLVLISLFVSNILAGEDSGQGGAFLRIGAGPRAKAMGNAYTALADQAYGAFYNPAGVAFTSREAATSYSRLSFDRQFNTIAYSAEVPPKAGISLLVIQSGFSDQKVRDTDGQLTGGNIEISQYAVSLGFAIRFTEKFSAGIAPKVLYSKIYDVSASSFGADLGVLVKPVNSLSIGLALQNFGQKLTYKRNATSAGDEETLDKIPQSLRLGAAYKTNWSGPFRSILFSSDLEKISGYNFRMHTGAEVNLLDRFYLRLGINYTDWTTGFSIPFQWSEKTISFDYAFIFDRREGLEIGTHDFGVRVAF